ncbi:FG-GAP-like repeat-containing protein [Owenweeksia hongkongensis]|uniref:FG-GAP-like repeat-containing protein n=1 Tax=Owenweeksia hongkongensis TaxID=253245 RepID=UPI003A933E39
MRKLNLIFAVTLSVTQLVSGQYFGSELTVSNTPLSPRGVDAIDVDQDGDMDILGISQGGDAVAWYENDGSQNFTTHTIDNTAGTQIRAADFDGDSDIDIVASLDGTNEIALYTNNGSQSFTKSVILSNAKRVEDLKLVDFDSDGDMDVLSAVFGQAYAPYVYGRFFLHTNNGSGSFSTTLISASTPYYGHAQGIDAADLDGDSDLDVAVAWRAGSEKLGWYENTGSGFTWHLVQNGDNPFNVSTVDVDNDGDFDIISTHLNDDIKLSTNNGSGSFTVTVITNTNDFNYYIDLGNPDGDSDMDFMVATVNKLLYFSNNGSGIFTTHVVDASHSGHQAVFADVDNDGNLEPVSYKEGFPGKINWYDCVAPTNLGTTNLTCNSVDLLWTDPGSASDWIIEYGPSGFSLGSGIVTTSSTTTKTISSLNGATSYEFYVKSDCSAGGYSVYTGPYLFTTPECPPCQRNFDFSADAHECNVQFSLNLPSFSPYQVVGYEWRFGDGTSSNEENPIHFYQDANDYTVCVELFLYDPATGECCVVSYCEGFYADGCGDEPCRLEAELLYEVDDCCNFTFSLDFLPSNTSGVVNVLWDFGDGTTAMGLSVDHVFPAPGGYQVCYTIVGKSNTEGECCTSEKICTEIDVQCEGKFEKKNSTNYSYEEMLDIFPNPAINQININYTITDSKSEVMLYIYDAIGNQVYSRKMNSSEEGMSKSLVVETTAFPAGIYFVKVVTEKSNSQKSFVIQ